MQEAHYEQEADPEEANYKNYDEGYGMSNKYNKDREYLYDDNFSHIIGNTMQTKYNNLDHSAQSNSGDELIETRSRQLATAKILVNIHERDP